MTNQTFFSLIRLSIGTSDSLFQCPTTDEWIGLYRMAIKQSLVGVCFVGLRRYLESAQQQRENTNIPKELYCQWLSAAIQIQLRNEQINQRCVQLQARLSSSGINNSILKGQGVAALYGELKNIRQSGDIDVWCQGRSIEQIATYLKVQGYTYHATAAHVETEFFEGVPVEFHAYPSFFRCPWMNRRLQKWFDSFNSDNFDDSLGFRTPPFEFNIIFLLIHMFHHVIYEGLGFRQLMDYYFLLVSNSHKNDYTIFIKIIGYLGLNKFASAVMWVLKEVFGLSKARMICFPDEKLGQLLLEEILQGGNFGQYSSRQKVLRDKNVIIRTFNYTKRRLSFFAMAPEEVICAPFWSLWHYCWRKRRGYIQ